ncbi:MAG TPA: hypothetical protein PLZ61_02450 [Candidatus Cryosericum sp.]|nr:hypothetical protein [Candidatus Cryosericum sp.]
MASIRWGLGSGADLCVPFTGNVSLSGCRLIGAGLPDDNVALEYATRAIGESAVFYVPMTEGGGNALDTVGSHDASVSTWATPGWHGDYCVSGQWGKGGDYPKINVLNDWVHEFWWYRGEVAFISTSVYICANNEGNRWRCGVSFWEDVSPAQLRVRVRGQNTIINLIGPLPELNTWTHLAAERSGNTGRLYMNGQVAHTVDLSGIDAYYNTQETFRSSGLILPEWQWQALYGATAAEYAGTAFSPARYKSAGQNEGTQPYVTCTYAALAGMVPTEVSWSATEGDGYGRIKRVYVNDLLAGWTQVGGDYPTSPVSVSGLVLPSEDAVRVELEPKADALQSETPVLDWLHLEYTLPVTGGRVYRPTPLRFGPKLLPIGVLA